MFDEWFRLHKERWLRPLAALLGRWCSPLAVTLLAFAAGVGAAVAAGQALWQVALALWITNRFLDGIDGVIARVQRTESHFGGYLDIVLDFVVYASIPIGIAVAMDTRAVWLVVTVLLASYFVNAASWMYLAAIQEQRGHGAAARGELTSVTMPRGLVAGTETVVFFVLFLLFPMHFVPLAWAMAAGVVVGISQRLVWAARNLH